MLAAIEFIAIADGPELAEGAGQGRFRLATHKAFRVEAIADQVGDVDQPQPMPAGVVHQLRQTGHGAIAILDFADHPSGVETRQP